MRDFYDLLAIAARDSGVDPLVAEVFRAFGASLVDDPEPVAPPPPSRRFPATYARASWRTVSRKP